MLSTNWNFQLLWIFDLIDSLFTKNLKMPQFVILWMFSQNTRLVEIIKVLILFLDLSVITEVVYHRELVQVDLVFAASVRINMSLSFKFL